MGHNWVFTLPGLWAYNNKRHGCTTDTLYYEGRHTASGFRDFAENKWEEEGHDRGWGGGGVQSLPPGARLPPGGDPPGAGGVRRGGRDERELCAAGGVRRL